MVEGRSPEEANGLRLGSHAGSSQPIRRLQIVLGGLIAAWVISAAIIAGMAHAVPRQPTKLTVLAYSGAVVAAAGLLVRRLVDRMLIDMKLRGVNLSRLRTDRIGGDREEAQAALALETQVFFIMRQWLIVRTAILEAAALYQSVAYFAERSWISLTLAALLMLPVLMQFPTRNGTRLWIARRVRALDERRVRSPLSL